MLKDKESGQSILIITLSVLALLALVAVVVDVGNGYAHRRLVQNGCDAAALAGARRLAERGIGEAVLEYQVLKDVERFAEENGLDPKLVRAWFINANGDRLETVDPWLGPARGDAEGVEVAGDLPFTTYFAHLLGFPTMTASTTAKAWVLTGPCSGDKLFPVTVPTSLFTETEGVPDIGTVYTLWEEGDKDKGNWKYIRWQERPCDPKAPCRSPCGTDGCGEDAGALGGNIEDNSCSGFWEVGDWVCGWPGEVTTPVLDPLFPYVTDDPWPEVIIPLFDQKEGEGQHRAYRIAGFAAFQLRCVVSTKTKYVEHFKGDCDVCLQKKSKEKCIRGEFVRIVQPGGKDGCTDTGIYIPSFRKPAPQP